MLTLILSGGGGGGGKLHSTLPVVFGLPFLQTTSDQPEAFPRLIFTVDTQFHQKSS